MTEKSDKLYWWLEHILEITVVDAIIAKRNRIDHEARAEYQVRENRRIAIIEKHKREHPNATIR
jgi:predicted alpha-1,6-mannanase (GH76 family)